MPSDEAALDAIDIRTLTKLLDHEQLRVRLH
jgi:hypothetical protein